MTQCEKFLSVITTLFVFNLADWMDKNSLVEGGSMQILFSPCLSHLVKADISCFITSYIFWMCVPHKFLMRVDITQSLNISGSYFAYNVSMFRTYIVVTLWGKKIDDSPFIRVRPGEPEMF